jgi:hypothetical protein
VSKAAPDDRYRQILDDRGIFNPAWLCIDGKEGAPLPAPNGVDSYIQRRIRSGFESIDCSHVVTGKVGTSGPEGVRVDMSPPMELARLPERLETLGGDALITAPDLSAAVVISSLGYMLAAGSKDFMRATVIGVDWARERFEYYASYHREHPVELLAVSRQYAPRKRSWRTVSEVAPGSAASEQLQLMEDLLRGRIDGSHFARQWFRVRSRGLKEGEMLSIAFEHLLNQVFYELDDRYAIAPSTREEGDMTEEELKEFVQHIHTEIHKL